MAAFQKADDHHPEQLSGLKQAMYVLQQIQSGATYDNIATALENDRQMTEIWISFLKDLNWIVRDETNNRWVLTERGRTRAANYFRAEDNVENHPPQAHV